MLQIWLLFSSGFILPNGKEKRKKISNASDQVIKKPSWLKKGKLLFLCSDQNILKTRSGNIIKFGIKYPHHIYFTNVKVKNLYILTFCENNGSAKLA